MIDYRAVYDGEAEAYDRMVSAEDGDGNLAAALEAVRPLAGAYALEVGAGTGRITRLLARRGARVVAFDRSRAMIEVARRRLPEIEAAGVTLFVADALDFPRVEGPFDLAIAGWVFGHFTEWFPGSWAEAVLRALDAMHSALRPGGDLVLIETLGTGNDEPPAPPSPGLACYYGWLERERGFSRREIRTDYVFPDPEAAAAATGFFFGEDFARAVLERGWSRVPEWTGVWSRAK